MNMSQIIKLNLWINQEELAAPSGGQVSSASLINLFCRAKTHFPCKVAQAGILEPLLKSLRERHCLALLLYQDQLHPEPQLQGRFSSSETTGPLIIPQEQIP